MKDINKDFSKHGGKKDSHEQAHNQQDFKAHVKQSWLSYMHSVHKKLSCGSAQIASILKTRTHWGTNHADRHTNRTQGNSKR